MSTNRRQRITAGLSAALITSVAVAAFAGPVAAAPDPDKAAERAERKAAQEAAKVERKAEREAAQEERKAERDAAKGLRVELREQRKAELETRKTEAKALKAEARAAITELRDGFAKMSVEERKATLEEIRGVRDGYQVLFLALMESWRDDRADLLPNTLADTPDETEVELVGEEESEEA